MTSRIAASYLIWLVFYLPMIALSAVVVPVMLARGWDGYSTWFGNRKYGRFGNDAYRTQSRFQEWQFLVLRNPISNFGKEVMSLVVRGPVTVVGDITITDNAPGIAGAYVARSGWAWEIRIVKKTFPGRCFEGRWGWKIANKNIGEQATFVCRANPFRRFG